MIQNEEPSKKRERTKSMEKQRMEFSRGASMITRKYYVALANMIGTSASFAEFEKKLIDFLGEDNSRFDPARFCKAIRESALK